MKISIDGMKRVSDIAKSMFKKKNVMILTSKRTGLTIRPSQFIKTKKYTYVYVRNYASHSMKVKNIIYVIMHPIFAYKWNLDLG